MARGWESKAIESQLEDKSREEHDRRRPLTPEERLRAGRRRTLELSRARLLADLAASRVAAHRAMLGQALSALEAELASLGEQPG